MGYDMHIKAEMTEAERLAKEAATAQFEAAVAVRNKRDQQLKDEGAQWPHIIADAEHVAAQEEVDKAYEAMDAANLYYYRLNIWGMGRCREYMNERGMLATKYDQPEWKWPEYIEVERNDGESDKDYRARYNASDEAYNEACRPILSWSPEGVDNLIPIHKLCGNDGWLVTEIECKTAAAIGREAPTPTYIDEQDGNKEKPLGWWDSWLSFLERASTRGGFEVH